MDILFSFLQMVGAGVISNLISSRVSKWLDKLLRKLR